MFGLFKSPPFSDATLGEFQRKNGVWRGSISLGDTKAPLALPGPRAAPDAAALEVARAIPSAYPGWRERIASAMLDHYRPYAEAVAAGELEPPEGGLPRISQAQEVWSYTSVEFVAVITLDRNPGCIEIGYRVAWDEEHTLGARLRDGHLVELNGSVLAP